MPAESTSQKGSSILEQYDLGDTSQPAPVDPPGATPAPVVPAVQDEQAPASSRPRNPDGTFAPLKPQHPSYLIGQALDLGLSDEEIAQTSTEALGNTVRHLSRQAREFAKQQADARDTQAALERQRPEPHEPSPPQRIDIGLTPEQEAQYDEGLIGLFRSMTQKMANLEAQLGQMQQIHQANFRDTVAGKLDRAFSEMGKDYESWLGKGRGKDMGQDSIELTRRRAIVALAVQMAGQNADADKVAQAIPEATKKFLGVQSKPQATEEPRESVEQRAWREAGLALPTNRQSPPEPHGAKRAEKAVQQYMRENGAASGAGVSPEDDDFL